MLVPRRSSKRTASVAVLLALLAAPSVARADDANDARKADALYNEAIALITKGHYAEACPKLEQSQRLDAGLGTEFHLADCYEHVGRLGTALSLYRSVSAAAHAADKQKLARLADERIAQVKVRAPRLVLTFAAPEPAVDVLVDGVRVGSNDWAGEGLPIDPGQREVEVHVVGKQPWRRAPMVREGEVVKLQVDLVAPPAPPAPPPTVTLQPPSRLRPVWAAVAGVGLVVSAVGTTAGFMAIGQRNDARDACGSDDPKQCRDRAAVDKWDRALTTANVSTVSLVAGGALFGAGAVLWLLGGPKTTRVTAGADHRGGRLGVEGYW